jgi:hypothetical protein
VLSPALFNFYLSDLPTPSYPVKLVSYADDIKVYASGAQIPAPERAINAYLPVLIDYLDRNGLAISPAKSNVTLFSPDPAQSRLEPNITINGQRVPFTPNIKILGVIFDTQFTFNKMAAATAAKVSKRNNVLKALSGSDWGQQKETLLATYNGIGRSVLNYGCPIWAPNLSKTNMNKLQVAQNAGLRVATGAHKMASISHLHQEATTMTVKDHCDLLSAQFYAACTDPSHPNHDLTIRPLPARAKKQSLKSLHDGTVAAHLRATVKKTQQALHTAFVRKGMDALLPNPLLGVKPPPINADEKLLPRKDRTLLCQLRSSYCSKLNNYQHRINPAVPDECNLCGATPHDVRHVFNCPRNRTVLTVENLWSDPVRCSKMTKF